MESSTYKYKYIIEDYTIQKQHQDEQILQIILEEKKKNTQ